MDVTRNERVLMSTVRHVWALDGDVQSCHRMPTIMVDEECAGFPAAVTDVVALTPFLTPPMDLSRFLFWRRQESGVRTIGWPRQAAHLRPTLGAC